MELIHRFLAALLVLSSGLQLFIYSPKRAVFWILFTVFILAAILLFTMHLGVLASRLSSDNGVLTIRWKSWLFRRHLLIGDITGITEDRRFIRIRHKGGKETRLPVKLVEPDQRREVRIFLKSVTGF